jgi:hypothetical protein
MRAKARHADADVEAMLREDQAPYIEQSERVEKVGTLPGVMVSFRERPDVIAKIDALAQSSERTRTQMLRFILREYLRGQSRR